ncbi:MAG: hypothetical protein JKY65_19925, partial [Planctomycetes bacterium]|nr:hypothetical protein [Planctomycetota bacterium]
RARQVALLEAGLEVRQETRLWSEDWDPARAKADAYEADVPAAHRAALAPVVALLPAGKDGWRGRTGFMRSKEDTQDYRYFPEPDLPPIALDEGIVTAIRAALPELPGARRRRFVEVMGLSQKAAEVLARDYALADYFEAVVAAGAPAGDAINLVLNQVAALLNEQNLEASGCPVPATWLAELVALMGELPKDLVLKQVWPKVVKEALSPREIVAKHKIEAVSADAIREATDAAWAANPKAVADLLGGNKKAGGAIVGAVMKATKGKASPQEINARIQELLAEAKG